MYDWIFGILLHDFISTNETNMLQSIRLLKLTQAADICQKPKWHFVSHPLNEPEKKHWLNSMHWVLYRMNINFFETHKMRKVYFFFVLLDFLRALVLANSALKSISNQKCIFGRQPKEPIILFACMAAGGLGHREWEWELCGHYQLCMRGFSFHFIGNDCFWYVLLCTLSLNRHFIW